uniref:RRM domain-containing protein n=1 Tax=Caenorhabditis japonica TaxID=281687 RepID=A0A8R1HIR0_CAEJA
MSVSEPADSGSSQTASQVLQVEKIEDIANMGSWAQMMEEEEENLQFEFGEDSEDVGVDEVDCGGDNASVSPERRRHIPDEPPFRVQITNLSPDHIEEELIYYFGGDKLLKCCDFHKEDGKAEFEFHARDGLTYALTKSNVEFKGRLLKVYVLQNRVSLARVSQRQSKDYNRQYESTDSSFSRRNDRNRYNSQSSLNSDKHSRFERGNRGHYQNQHYGTMPAGGFHANRGVLEGHRGGFHGGYNNDNNRSFRGHSRVSFLMYLSKRALKAVIDVSRMTNI